MTRTRTSAKQAGTRFETVIAAFLAQRLDDDRIERRTKNGAFDRGDITGIKTIAGGRVCLELKDYGGQFHISEWLREITVEAGNDDAPVGAVIAKRRGVTDPGEQVCFMTVETLCRLIEGGIYEPVIVHDPMTEMRP